MIQLNPNRKPEKVNPDASEKTATNSFTTLDGGLVSALNVAFTPIQDLHGQSKPWAGGAGKNLVGLDHSPAGSASTQHVTVSDKTDDTVTLTSDGSGTYSYYRIEYTLPAGLYTAQVKTESSDSYTPICVIYDPINTNLSGTIQEGTSRTFTLNAETTVNIRFFATTSDTTARTVRFYDFMLEKGSTPTSYEPYSNICPISGHTQVQSKINNTTYTTSLGDTYYGGDVEQVGGTGEVTYGVTDLGTASFTYYGDGLFGVASSTIKPETHINIICSCYKSYEGINNVTGTSTAKAYMSDGDIASKEGSKEIFIKDTRYSDADVLKAALSGQSVVYELATPTALTLTGQNITAEVGENNVSAPLENQEIVEDGVTYKEMFSWADVVAYVQSQVNP